MKWNNSANSFNIFYQTNNNNLYDIASATNRILLTAISGNTLQVICLTDNNNENATVTLNYTSSGFTTLPIIYFSPSLINIAVVGSATVGNTTAPKVDFYSLPPSESTYKNITFPTDYITDASTAIFSLGDEYVNIRQQNPAPNADVSAVYFLSQGIAPKFVQTANI